ncbi:MAG: sigma-70 family RNA polymerase sigma factor [Bryobacteraceae bacterium]
MSEPIVGPISQKEDDSPQLEQLMVAYQQADASATERLLSMLCPILGRFFGSMPDTRLAVDDLVQETLLRVHRARHTYRAGEPLLPWVYAIARHTRVDHFRKTRRQSKEEQLDPSELQAHAAPPTPNQSLPDFETLMGYLPDSQREVLTMLKVLGMTVDEVARATSSTGGAVKQKAHRAYEKLRAVLENWQATGSHFPSGGAKDQPVARKEGA